MNPEDIHPQDADFQKLLSIVADVYRLKPAELVTRRRTHNITQPRHVVAAIWSEANSLQDTADRLLMWSPATISDARSRVAKLLAHDGLPAARIKEVMRRVATEAPHIVGLYPETEP